MCTNYRYIRNQYTCRSVLVPCGKCDSCVQEKANRRAQKIRLHASNGQLCLFVTLTYDNHFVPYLKKSDIISARENYKNGVDTELPIYRDYVTRSYLGVQYTTRCKSPVSTVYASDLNFSSYLPYLKKKRDCVGVILFSDVQKFIKRLRILISRSPLLHETKVTYYAVSEYGSGSYRPHFHLLIYFSQGSLETWRPFIIKAWPNGDCTRANKRIQVAHDAAGYVASYINKSANLPKICSSVPIRQKSSHSFHFGLAEHILPLNKILEKVKSRNFSVCVQRTVNKVPVLVDVPVPAYIVNHYFPKFKGYFLFTDDEILQLLRSPFYYWSRLGETCKKQIFVVNGKTYETYVYLHHGNIVTISPEEYRSFCVRMYNAYQYYHQVTGYNLYDFAIDYCAVWRCRTHYCNKMLYEDVDDFTNFYQNIGDVYRGLVHAPTLDITKCQERYNARLDLVIKSRNLSALKNRKDSIKRANGLMLSEMYDDL